MLIAQKENEDRDFNDLAFKIYLNGLIDYFLGEKLSEEEFTEKILALIKQYKNKRIEEA